MATSAILQRATAEAWSDEEIVERVLAGETGAFEVIMRRYNQRLYRVAMGILRNDTEAEDVMQDAYVRAFEHLSQFAGRAKFSTWLTRIAVHEALARARRGRRMDALEDIAGPSGEWNMTSHLPDPEKVATEAETDRLLEDAVLSLPDSYREVLTLRDIEEMSTAEAAEALQISEENVKIRLHRARRELRNTLFRRMGPAAKRAFAFPATRCDRVVNAVFQRIASMER